MPEWAALFMVDVCVIYGQHSSQSLCPHVCFSRCRMPDSNCRPPAWPSDALTTKSRKPFSNKALCILCRFNQNVIANIRYHCCYRSGTVNSNTVNSKFHLIRSLL